MGSDSGRKGMQFVEDDGKSGVLVLKRATGNMKSPAEVGTNPLSSDLQGWEAQQGRRGLLVGPILMPTAAGMQRRLAEDEQGKSGSLPPVLPIL